MAKVLPNVLTEYVKDGKKIEENDYLFESSGEATVFAAALLDHILMVRPDWEATKSHPTNGLTGEAEPYREYDTVAWLCDPKTPGKEFMFIALDV